MHVGQFCFDCMSDRRSIVRADVRSCLRVFAKLFTLFHFRDNVRIRICHFDFDIGVGQTYWFMQTIVRAESYLLTKAYLVALPMEGGLLFYKSIYNTSKTTEVMFIIWIKKNLFILVTFYCIVYANHGECVHMCCRYSCCLGLYSSRLDFGIKLTVWYLF